MTQGELVVAVADLDRGPKHVHFELSEAWLQRVLDNPWLLLALGVIIPLLSYTVWGWIEILNVKPAALP